MKEGRASFQALSSEKKQLLEDADELMARKAALEVTISDLDARVAEEKTTKVRERGRREGGERGREGGGREGGERWRGGGGGGGREGWLRRTSLVGVACTRTGNVAMYLILVILQETSLSELDQLKDRITETREELDNVLPLFQTQKAEEERLNSL